MVRLSHQRIGLLDVWSTTESSTPKSQASTNSYRIRRTETCSVESRTTAPSMTSTTSEFFPLEFGQFVILTLTRLPSLTESWEHFMGNPPLLMLTVIPGMRSSRMQSSAGSSIGNFCVVRRSEPTAFGMSTDFSSAEEAGSVSIGLPSPRR